MKVEHRGWLDPCRKYLCITHSDRITDLERCSLNFLETRYASPARVKNLPPFETLEPISQHQQYHGAVTIWEFARGFAEPPRLLACLKPDHKPQYALWHLGRLWVLGVDRLEVYDSQFRRCADVRDPWLSGGHTAVPDGTGNLLLTCSGSDSILVMNESRLEVTRVHRMPESLYGHNYALARTDSVVDHYIVNDYQLTHVNCAWPWRNGIIVSMLIQGAIGWFDRHGEYTELLRGFVGCHGVRPDLRGDGLLFSDSATGTVVFLDDRLRIRERVSTGSLWLHDACQITADLLVLCITDRNAVEFVAFPSRETVFTLDASEFGQGPQFAHYGC